jgi:hypothetical protein
MIDQILRGQTQLKSHVVTERDLFGQVGIELNIIWSLQRVYARVSKSPYIGRSRTQREGIWTSGYLESRWVEPLREAATSGRPITYTRNDVWTQVVGVVGIRNIEAREKRGVIRPRFR